MKFESKIAKNFLAGILSVALVATIGMPMAFGDEDAEMALDVINDATVAEEAVDDTTLTSEEEWNVPAIYTNAAPFCEPAIGGVSQFAMLSTRAAADEADALAENAKDGLVTSKEVSGPSENGEYALTLEAYATGSKVTTAVTESIPTDIVLVLDQSGSMSSSFGYVYEKVYEAGSGSYYVYVDGEPVRAYYCSTCGAWYTASHSGWFGSHSAGTRLGVHKTSADDNTEGSIQVYSRSNSVSRLEALETAATNFVNQVYAKSAGADEVHGTSDDVDHRIAIVGFASTGSSYTNTEILSTANVVNYGSATDANYADALVSVQGANGVNARLTTAIGRLDDNGDTYSEYGFDMANKVFANNALDAGEKRNRVVIMFTDGYTAPSGTNNIDYGMSDRAIANAQVSKSTHSASVYTIGIFSDANPAADITTNFSYGSTNAAGQLVAANRYMHYCSSNYPDAESLQLGGNMSSKVDPFNRGDSYYLTAADASSLNTIFDEISKEIESGGSSITLNESAVVKDVITKQFALPDGVAADDIKVYTSAYKDDGSFANKVAFADAKVSIDLAEDGLTTVVSVSNFDYADNWVGTETAADGTKTAHGKKLIIEIPIVVRDGFLGGNGVPTNADTSGVYENEDAETAVELFLVPDVDVAIKPITVTAANKNVYLLGGLTTAQLLEGAKVTCGGETATYTSGKFDFEPWQNAYVTIDVPEYTDGGYQNIIEDKAFTLDCEIAPKTEGTAVAQKAEPATGNVYVYKPFLTYADQEVWYGGAAPEEKSLTYSDVAWKHGAAVAVPGNMIGDAPTITDACDIADSAVVNGLIATPNDIPVSATAKIGDTDVTSYVTFVHANCGVAGCSWNEVSNTNGKPAFLLHSKTCTLTIKKTVSGGVEDNQSFIFDVKGGKSGLLANKDVARVSIQGASSTTITDLPVGDFVVTEDTSWSWRYDSSNATQEAALSEDAPAATVTISNSRDNTSWLGGDAFAINTFVDGIINALNNGREVEGAPSASVNE